MRDESPRPLRFYDYGRGPYYFAELSRQQLEARGNAEYKSRLNRHPACDDPAHPGCYDCWTKGARTAPA